MREKREILRRCISCRASFPRQELYRIIRISDTEVALDPTYKANGRGAYVRKDLSCLEDKKLKGKLQIALRVRLDDVQFENLLEHMKEGV